MRGNAWKSKLKYLADKTWVYVLLLLVMIFAVSLKKNYQMDEIYSYGLANNVGQTAIHPKFAPYTYENPAQAFLEYMVIEEGEGFSISNCWYNQERESSPPFYYFAVHIASVFAGTRFTRWTGASVNLVFIVLALVMFRKILRHFGTTDCETNLYSVFFAISPAIINDVVLFRMYVMFLFEAMFLTYTVLHYKGKENWKFYILMILGSVFGVLTHYYMIFFVFFLSLVYGMTLLFERAWRKALKFIMTMAAAGGLAYLIFPGMIWHLFSAGRGEEGIQNLQGSATAHAEQLQGYLRILNREFFGYRFGWFLMVAVLLLVAGLLKHWKERKQILGIKNDNMHVFDIAVLVIPSACYIVMIAKVAPYTVDRYIMGTFGLIIITFLLGLRELTKFCFSGKKIVGNAIMLVICVGTLVSVNREFHISYLYLGDQEFLETMDSYADVDALCVTSEGWRISGNFNDMIKLNSLTFFRNEIDTLASMESLKQKSEYILYVVDNDPETIIQRIYEICPQINASEYVAKADVAHIYHLYCQK